MDYEIKIYNLQADSPEQGKKQLEAIMNMAGLRGYDIKYTKENRTDRQNNALHLYFRLLSDALNDAGYDMREVIRKDVDIPWSAETIKKHIWKPVQEAYLKKDSTTKLNTDEVDKVYKVVDKTISERTGVHVEFPSIDNIINIE